MQTSAAECHKSFTVCEAILAMEALILALMAATRLKYTQVSRLFGCAMLGETKKLKHLGIIGQPKKQPSQTQKTAGSFI